MEFATRAAAPTTVARSTTHHIPAWPHASEPEEGRRGAEGEESLSISARSAACARACISLDIWRGSVGCGRRSPKFSQRPRELRRSHRQYWRVLHMHPDARL